MSFTNDQLTKLDDAIAQGVLSVQYTDKRVTYRSLSEMIQLRDLMRKELGLTPKRKVVFAKFKKGLC